MSSKYSEPLRRELFLSGTETDARDARLLELLIAQDGSTTRLCETVAGGPIDLQVIHQHVTRDVPALVREHLPGTDFIERVTSLTAHGQVMMDNLTYVALEGLGSELEADLRAGREPIGHLLARLWVRRQRIVDGRELPQKLWSFVGHPDAPATRVYAIVEPNGPRMVIAETWRRGMRMMR